ncbi:hypothetical protein K2173_028230 [Erythroxylum novogranatense]|uniref:Protein DETOXIFICATION n=1 Tax=Erythroxylum novogranatense TaxID=1862640 RepID=A0AAV8U1J0_9ROSI|nr:hypothetical protein K2173_028230 [Erythroxylum novogranatense]
MEREEHRQTLNSPLIGIACEGDTDGFGNRERSYGSEIRRKEIIDEVKKQLWLAGPLVAVNLLQYCLQIISVMFVGHLGELSLSGASMATSFASVTGFSLLLGMASALDTFCGQSYGARQHHMLGIYTQRAMLVLCLVSIPLALIWANTRSILAALGQDEDIAIQAGIYARFFIPTIFAYGLLQCLVKFLQTQSIVFPMMLSSGITALLHLPVCWILVFKSGLGMRGAALANCFSYWLNVLLLALYIKFSSLCTKTWTGFSKEALHNIPSFLKLAIPSAVMVCLEMWSFEMMVLLSGLLPNPKLETSVLSICLTTGATVWMIPYGLSNAARCVDAPSLTFRINFALKSTIYIYVYSTRVSNELGAGNYSRARLAIYAVLVLAITEGILVGSVLIAIRNIWGLAFSNEAQVTKYVAAMLPLIAGSNLLDGLQCVLSGTARGCGWQKIGAFINLGSYYLVGLPSGILMAFVLHIGGRGLWLGIICALAVQALSLLMITFRAKWEEEAQKATKRVFEATFPTEIVA